MLWNLYGLWYTDQDPSVSSELRDEEEQNLMRDELRGCKRSHPEHTLETSLMLIVHRSSTAEDLIDEDQVLIDAYLQKFCKKDFRTASDCLCQKLRKDAGIDSVLDP